MIKKIFIFFAIVTVFLNTTIYAKNNSKEKEVSITVNNIVELRSTLENLGFKVV